MVCGPERGAPGHDAPFSTKKILRLAGFARRVGDDDLGFPVGGADAGSGGRGRNQPGLTGRKATRIASVQGEHAGGQGIEPVGETAGRSPVAGPVGIHPAVDVVAGGVAARRGPGGEGADAEPVARIVDARPRGTALGGALLPLVDAPLIAAGAVVVDLVEGIGVEGDRLLVARRVVNPDRAGWDVAGRVPARVVDVEGRIRDFVEEDQRKIGAGLPGPKRDQRRAALILREAAARQETAGRRLVIPECDHRGRLRGVFDAVLGGEHVRGAVLRGVVDQLGGAKERAGNHDPGGRTDLVAPRVAFGADDIDVAAALFGAGGGIELAELAVAVVDRSDSKIGFRLGPGGEMEFHHDLVTQDDGRPEPSIGVSIGAGVGPLDHGAVGVVEPQRGTYRKLETIQAEIETERTRRGDPQPPD